MILNMFYISLKAYFIKELKGKPHILGYDYFPILTIPEGRLKKSIFIFYSFFCIPEIFKTNV